MESLSYAFEGRPLLFTEDTDIQVDSLVRRRTLLKKWDGEGGVVSMECMEPLLPDMVKRSLLSDETIQSASTVTLNSLTEFSTRFSSSENQSKDEKLAAPTESNRNTCCIDSSVLPNPEPTLSTKRSRLTTFQCPVPTCQVYGCNKDLSSSKDYHKRHKVCDVHSKTPVVIINGIRQRFCQQCSRFHILAEFDEGKRSCRKRLAGHNERRRKPQFDTHMGSTYFPTNSSKTSLIFSKILPTSFFGLQYDEPARHSKHVKLEEDVKFDEPLPKSVLCFHCAGKQYPSRNCPNATLTSFPDISGGSNSSIALSLLSARPHNLPSNSRGFSMPRECESFIPIISNSSGVELEQLPVGSEISQMSPETNAPKMKCCPSSEGVNTVNLLELSLHLRRVEEQRYYSELEEQGCYSEVKLENGIFCDSTMI